MQAKKADRIMIINIMHQKLILQIYGKQVREWKFRCRMDAGEGPSLLTLDTPMHANGRL